MIRFWHQLPHSRFYFAITENEEIRLKGEFLVSSAYNASKTKESLYMFFTSDGNLRMARDPSVFNFPESIELIDTSIIESKINSIYKKGNEVVFKTCDLLLQDLYKGPVEKLDNVPELSR